MPPHRLDHSVTVSCPRCGGDVKVPVEWEAPELYGADADGHRGMWVDGYWYGSIEALDPMECQDGQHDWTEAELQTLQRDIEAAAAEYDRTQKEDRQWPEDND